MTFRTRKVRGVLESVVENSTSRTDSIDQIRPSLSRYQMQNTIAIITPTAESAAPIMVAIILPSSVVVGAGAGALVVGAVGAATGAVGVKGGATGVATGGATGVVTGGSTSGSTRGETGG